MFRFCSGIPLSRPDSSNTVHISYEAQDTSTLFIALDGRFDGADGGRSLAGGSKINPSIFRFTTRLWTPNKTGWLKGRFSVNENYPTDSSIRSPEDAIELLSIPIL